MLVKRIPYHGGATSRESTVSVLLNGVMVAQTQASPTALRELAIGHLVARGLLEPDESARIETIDVDEDNREVRVELSGEARALELRELTSSGEATLLHGSEPPLYPLAQGHCFKPDLLAAAQTRLCEYSPLREEGQSVHACALMSYAPECAAQPFHLFEDIGRHNALDKAIGYAVLNDIDLGWCSLHLTGRISREMALKAVRVRCSFLVTRKAVTDAACALAQEYGLSLVGHCEPTQLEIYTHDERLEETDGKSAADV